MPQYFHRVTLCIRANGIFLIPFIVLWLAGLTYVLTHDKEVPHLLLNEVHTPFFNTFFRYITEIGSTVPVFICVLLLFVRVRGAVFAMTTCLTASTVTSILKEIFAVPRPKVLLEQLGYQLVSVEGVHLHTTNSFPSGHTTAAFALCFSIAVLVKNRFAKVALLLIAVLVGCSRIYLGQHFLEDVLAGSLIGLTAVLLMTPFFDDSKHWGCGSLQSYLCRHQSPKRD